MLTRLRRESMPPSPISVFGLAARKYGRKPSDFCSPSRGSHTAKPGAFPTRGAQNSGVLHRSYGTPIPVRNSTARAARTCAGRRQTARGKTSPRTRFESVLHPQRKTEVRYLRLTPRANDRRAVINWRFDFGGEMPADQGLIAFSASATVTIKVIGSSGEWRKPHRR